MGAIVKMTQTFRFDQYIFNLFWLDCWRTHNQWDSCGWFLSTRSINWIGSWRKNNHHWGLSLWFRKSASHWSVKTDIFSWTNIWERVCISEYHKLIIKVLKCTEFALKHWQIDHLDIMVIQLHPPMKMESIPDFDFTEKKE